MLQQRRLRGQERRLRVPVSARLHRRPLRDRGPGQAVRAGNLPSFRGLQRDQQHRHVRLQARKPRKFSELLLQRLSGKSVQKRRHLLTNVDGLF